VGTKEKLNNKFPRINFKKHLLKYQFHNYVKCTIKSNELENPYNMFLNLILAIMHRMLGLPIPVGLRNFRVKEAEDKVEKRFLS